MEKPTEHRPLDDFFRRNLNDASVQPSAEGWNRLQSRLSAQQLDEANKPTRRIGAAWYWATSMAAACLLLVYFWANSNLSMVETSTTELATITQSGKKVAPKSNRNKESLVVNETVVSVPVTTPASKLEPSNKPPKTVVEKQPEKGTNRTDRLITEPKTGVDPISLIAKNSEKQPEKTRAQPAPERNSAMASTTGEIATKAEQTNPERTLIVRVAEATASQLPTETITTQDSKLTDSQEASVKNTRIAQVFRQIKRIKDGEALAKAEANSNEDDDEESGLFNRLVRSARSKENQVKQQK